MAGFRKGKFEQAYLKMAMYGSAGDGKTTTASLIAEGLATLQGKEVAFVDTEQGTAFYRVDVPERKFHPQKFDFNYLDSTSATEIMKEVLALDPKKIGCVIIDSWTAFWAACRAFYRGPLTSVGTIPMHGWGKIKAPKEDFVRKLMSLPMHVIVCSREGKEYEKNQATGENQSGDFTAKGDQDTIYDMHIVVRMEGVRDPNTRQKIPTALIDKDRTGVLQGKVIPWPNFDTIAKPLLHLLGGTQAQMPSAEEVAQKDAEEMEKLDAEKSKKSASLKTQYIRAFAACQTKDDVTKIAKQLTPEVKKDFLKEDLDAVREAWEKATEATAA